MMIELEVYRSPRPCASPALSVRCVVGRIPTDLEQSRSRHSRSIVLFGAAFCQTSRLCLHTFVCKATLDRRTPPGLLGCAFCNPHSIIPRSGRQNVFQPTQ